jgi:hypothetical protein
MNKHDLKEHQHHRERAQAAQILLFVALGTAADAARTAHEATILRPLLAAGLVWRHRERVAVAVDADVLHLQLHHLLIRLVAVVPMRHADCFGFLPDHAFGNASGAGTWNSFFVQISQ